jgi:hypothetical protein
MVYSALDPGYRWSARDCLGSAGRGKGGLGLQAGRNDGTRTTNQPRTMS